MITLAPREFHLFQAAGRDFLYLVPSAAVFALDDATSAVLRFVTDIDEKRPRLERGAGGKPGEAGPPSEGERGWGPASEKK